MKIAVLGATGRTRTPQVEELLRRGHAVSALVRTPEKLGERRDQVTVITDDSTDPAALDALVDGVDAVISALGPRTKESDLRTRTAAALIEVMPRHGVSRFVGVSGAGTDVPGDRKGSRDKAISFMIRKLGGPVVADKVTEYREFVASDLDWTLVRAPRLQGGPATGLVAHDAHTPGRSSKIQRADLASFLVDVVEQGLYLRQAPLSHRAKATRLRFSHASIRRCLDSGSIRVHHRRSPVQSPSMDDRRDAAATDSLGRAIEAVLPSLEQFLKFEGQDPARRRTRWHGLLDGELPAEGVGRDAALAELAEVVVGNGLRIGHPGFSGWVTTGPTDVGAAADLAQAVAVPQRWWSTAGNFVDELAARWLIELLGLPSNSVGTFTSGGSTANLIGIGAARQHAGERLGLRPALDGIAGMVQPRVYASSATHDVVGRALGVLGMGRRGLRTIDTDRRGTIDLDLLQAALDEDLAEGCTQVAIVGCAGDVNTGRVDPLADLARIAHERGIWLHVDGAYGGFGLLDDRVRELFGDVATYDSFAVDPHKWLAAPVGTGAVFVRDEGVLGRAFTIETGDYAVELDVPIGQADLGSPFDEPGLGRPDWGVDFSTPARGLAVWAILREIGAAGMTQRVVRHDDYARHVARRARDTADMELLAEPVLSICCFRFRPAAWEDTTRLDALNEAILHTIRARGRVVTSSTRVDDRLAIRPCFINPRTTLADVDALVDEVLDVGRELAATSSS